MLWKRAPRVTPDINGESSYPGKRTQMMALSLIEKIDGVSLLSMAEIV
jgi:hypothetical protein